MLYWDLILTGIDGSTLAAPSLPSLLQPPLPPTHACTRARAATHTSAPDRQISDPARTTRPTGRPRARSVPEVKM
ncbi:hypothetical protein [Methanothrix soehngenii]|uniref:Uncharacterized protein n=1 Tax=Methanothrix soehngenii TaxID=2223 RepID=A0A7K4AL47_METSH|nr:hypothetical protein [Methanothrix soehngenii]